MHYRLLSPQALALPMTLVLALLFSNPVDAQFWKRGKNKKADAGEQSQKSEKKPADSRCEDITLQWMPDEDYSDLDAINLTGVSSVPIEVGKFEDRRRQDDLREIGRNIEDADEDDEKDRKILYVTTDDDIAVFVQTYTEEVLSELGFNVVGPGEGKVKVSGDVRKFHVVEGGTYKAQTRLLFRVANKSGKVVYEGMHGESESTFGRSYKCNNYLEVLSESLMETVHDLAGQEEFYDALKGIGG